MRSQALEDLFVQEIEELYAAEKQIYKGLGSMIKSTYSPELKAAFQNHQKQTKQQIDRLEKSFKILNEKPIEGDAPGISGLIRQSKEVARSNYERTVADAALITGAQKIEHYEIAAYGCVRTHAGILGYKEIESLLDESLKEEEEADALLTKIAKESVNASAAAAPYADARTGFRHEAHGSSESHAAEGGLSLGHLALGVAIGGALSVLFAPKPGSETRRQIGDSWRQATDRLTDPLA